MILTAMVMTATMMAMVNVDTKMMVAQLGS